MGEHKTIAYAQRELMRFCDSSLTIIIHPIAKKMPELFREICEEMKESQKRI